MGTLHLVVMLMTRKLHAQAAILASLAAVTILFLGLNTFLALPPFVQREASLVFARDGTLLTRIFVENREVISIGDVPEHLLQAIIATEDARFYRHFGLDPIGIGRALLEALRRRRFVEGASTITQQLARNLYDLPMERTLRRKLKEAYLAILLERHYTKQEILELYINEIYMGHGTYGVEAASRHYFNKRTRDLNLAEAAMLAGLIRGPEWYSPRANLERAEARQAWVLGRMVTEGYITENEATAAKEAAVVLADAPRAAVGGELLRSYIRTSLEQHMPNGSALAAVAGLRIFTTLDTSMQAAAESALARLADLTENRTGQNGVIQPQGALVALDPKTGEIRALVGGRGNAPPGFNRAVEALRQPGSAFKPFVYATALQQGLTLASQITCEPVTFPEPEGPPWAPADFGGEFHNRPLCLREALVVSCNVVAARLIHQVTPAAAAAMARRLGLTTPLRPVLSLALGTSETTPLVMAQAFAPFANGGRVLAGHTADPIVRVETRAGRVVREARPRLVPGALDPRIAYLVTSALRDVIASPQGTGRGVLRTFTRPAAGKTGTSEDMLDAWFVGYTPQLVAAVYVGNDRGETLGGTGGALAVPIWAHFMQAAHKGLPIEDFTRPEGIEEITICVESGLAAREACPADTLRTELFLTGTAPAEPCDVHRPALEWRFPWDWFR